MIKNNLKNNIKPFLKYLCLKDNIKYEEELYGTDLCKYTSLKLSESSNYIKYKTNSTFEKITHKNNNPKYNGELGETHSYLELIIPKEKLESIYGKQSEQYYILYVKAQIRKVYTCEIYAYTVDFKKWYTNHGLIEI